MNQQQRVERMEGAKPSNPKDAAATTRLDLSLFPASARAYGALAMTEGDLKYGGYNYREAGVCVSIYYAAANRHLDKFYNGEWADPKTKVPHLASALACIAVLIDGFTQGNINDDRPPTQDMGDLFDELQGIVGHLQEMLGRRAERYRADRQVYPSGDVEKLRRVVLTPEGEATLAELTAKLPPGQIISVPKAPTTPPVLYQGAPEDILDGWGNRR